MLVEEQVEYHVVLLDGLAPTPGEWRRAITGTVVFHLILLIILISIPRDNTEPTIERPKQITRLFDPPTRLTQKAPNKGPLTKEISVAPQIEAPELKPRTKPVAPPKRFAPPPAQQASRHANQPVPAPAAPQEPPKIKPTQVPPPVQIATATPPAVLPPSQQPKIALENVPPPPQPGHGTGLLKVPTGSVQEAVQALSQGNSPRVIPDQGGGPAARRQPSIDMEIMSDPNGVDMKPYLLRVLQSVRRNWLAVYPESARLGLRGQVVVQFAISPDGVISKTVFMSQAPSEALNRAVISAFSMSNPLPALPAEFKGSRLVLQFTFSYNVAK